MRATLQLTQVQLRVADLARSVDFYSRQLGFFVTAQGTDGAELAVTSGAAPILKLMAAPAAPPAPRDAAGLFHAALQFPSRAALGAWLKSAADLGVEFDGFSDHGVSEAIYFSDPDGNGLEFYCDRPRDQWPLAHGEIAMTTQPLDVRSLRAEAGATTATRLEGAHWGHLHLRVTNLDRSEEFYRAKLGMAVTQRSYPGARFLAADAYHHHLGLNTWGGPRHPQPAAALGLANATFASAGTTSIEQLTDPDGIHVRVVPLPLPTGRG